jgi:hypothetical protein
MESPPTFAGVFFLLFHNQHQRIMGLELPSRPIIKLEGIVCSGCGATHDKEKCPYCSRLRTGNERETEVVKPVICKNSPPKRDFADFVANFVIGFFVVVLIAVGIKHYPKKQEREPFKIAVVTWSGYDPK